MSGPLIDDPPHFPLDVEREIFEITARMYPQTCKSLTLVAKRVQTWIEPIQYERVTLHTPIDRAFVRVVPQRLAQYVRTLYIGWTVESASAKKVLEMCRNVVNLKFTMAYDTAYWPLLSRLRPMRLSIHAHALVSAPAPNFGCEFYRQLTHLRIFGYDLWPRWRLASIPALTHLSLDYFPDAAADDALRELLSDAPKLRILILEVDGGDGSLDCALDHLESQRIEDHRLTVFDRGSLRGWELVEEALWAAAERQHI